MPVAMLKLLLERGADVNASDQHGNTALMEAASKGCDREALKIFAIADALPRREPVSLHRLTCRPHPDLPPLPGEGVDFQYGARNHLNYNSAAPSFCLSPIALPPPLSDP